MNELLDSLGSRELPGKISHIKTLLHSVPLATSLALASPTILSAKPADLISDVELTQATKISQLEYKLEKSNTEFNILLVIASVLVLLSAYLSLVNLSNDTNNNQSQRSIRPSGELNKAKRKILELQKTINRLEGIIRNAGKEGSNQKFEIAYKKMIDDLQSNNAITGRYENTHDGVMKLIGHLIDSELQNYYSLQSELRDTKARLSNSENRLIYAEERLAEIDDNEQLIEIGTDFRDFFSGTLPQLEDLMSRVEETGMSTSKNAARYDKRDINSLRRRYAEGLHKLATIMDTEQQDSWLPRIITLKEMGDAQIGDNQMKEGIYSLVGAVYTIEYVIGFFEGGTEETETSGDWGDFTNTSFYGDNSGIFIENGEYILWLNNEFKYLDAREGGIINLFTLLDIDFEESYSDDLNQKVKKGIRPLLKKYIVRTDTENPEEYSLVNNILNTFKNILKSEESFDEYIHGLKLCYPEKYI